MDNHTMYYSCDQGTILLCRCHLCTNALITESCICKLNLNCNQKVCDKYCRVSREISLLHIDRLLALRNKRIRMSNINEEEV